MNDQVVEKPVVTEVPNDGRNEKQVVRPEAKVREGQGEFVQNSADVNGVDERK